MAEDWLADVRKYVADADEVVVGKIVRYCGIALQKRDSSLVSFSDKKETDRVRENYLKKKLGLADDDTTLDAAIASVGDRMKEDRTRNRVTVYYLLADHFGLLGIFGGAPKAVVAGAAAGAAGLAAFTPAPATAAPVTPPAPPPMAPVAASGTVGGAPAPRPQTVHAAVGPARSDSMGWGWVIWLLGGIVLAAFMAMVLRQMWHGSNTTPSQSVPVAASAPVEVPPAAQAPAATPVPQGAGVVAAERDAKPMLTVYFDTGKAAVSDEIATAAEAVKSYLDAHPGATLAVSGFNDPTGNAAANAELSKNRAKNVKAALEGLGIPADRVVLEKPADTTGTGATNTESRRVEVVVKE